jgi:lysophospholipase L1-like esterase
MQATNGSAATRRSQGRLIGCCMALIFALSALVFAPAAANAQEPTTSTYIALGDSISFGYTEERYDNHFPTESPSYFEEGFTNGFAKDLSKANEVGKGIRLVNDACPGETSNGLIGEDPSYGGAASTESYAEIEQKPEEDYSLWYGGYQGLGDWHPCKYTFQDHLPLHNGGYINGGKEVSQLEEALGTIESGTKVEAITLNIGSNDELAAITQCKDEVFYEFATKGKSKFGNSAEFAVLVCVKESAETVTVPHILQNLGDTIAVLDGAGYKGPIVLLGFYNPDTFQLPGSDELQEGLNTAVQEELLPKLKAEYGIENVALANPFPVFNKGAEVPGKPEKPAIELKSICTYTEMCNPNDPNGSKDDGDIHPTIKGYKEIAKLVNNAYKGLVEKGI